MNLFEAPLSEKKVIRFIDLFCGIGGFRIAMEGAAKAARRKAHCVFSSDFDKKCRATYAVNFGEEPFGDIQKWNENETPDHDVLLAGFPCQPFSIIGEKRGFEDARGTLFYDIARILKAKRPKMFLLENVKMLIGHDQGRTIRRIMETLQALDYNVEFRCFNAMDFGLPQKRQRVFILGVARGPSDGESLEFPVEWPQVGSIPLRPLSEIIESDPDPSLFASEVIRANRLEKLGERKQLKAQSADPTIWHENKSGEIGVNHYACALRAGASHSYLLVNGERRLSGREMLRLQGFPDSYQIVGKYSVIKKQAGNSLPVPVAQAVLAQALAAGVV